MNATVRTLSVDRVTIPFMMTKQHCGMLGLAFAVLLSAFSLIYIKDMNRREMAQLQQFSQMNNMEQNQHAQLLVQMSRLSSQGYIAELARTRLDMQTPDAKNVVMVQEG